MNADVDWEVLWAFPIAFVVGVVLCAAMFAVGQGMPGKFPADWSFADAWGANATLLGTLLTGVLASADPIGALFPADEEAALPLAVVGAAIAAALAAFAPICLVVFRAGDEKSATTVGVLLAGSLVTAAAAGELICVANAGTAVAGGDWDKLVWGCTLVALVALAAYTVRTIRGLGVDETLLDSNGQYVGPRRIIAF